MSYLIIFIIVLFGATNAQGGVFPGKTEYSVMLRSTYDSNVLCYSSQDRDRALNGTEKYQTPNSTLDDLRTDSRFTLVHRFKMMDKFKGRFQTSLNLSNYLNSQLNNAKWVSITYKQDVHNKFSVLYNYFYEPKYFIRDYSDVHTNERHHAEFALGKTVAKLYYRPNKTYELVVAGELKKYAYNKYFTEYDGDRFGIKGECIFRGKPWRASVSYGYGEFDNSGFIRNSSEQSIELIDDTETGESDYQEDMYSLSLEYSHKLFSKRTRTKIQFSAADRHYQTTRLPDIDPIHHARRDVVSNTTIKSSMRISKQIDFQIGGSFIHRDSKAYDPMVDRIKTYSRTLGWIELSYEL